VPVLVVVAHYDDECIGASHILYRHRRTATILHVTDSAPRDLAYARRAGFGSRAAYARARRAEMLAAVAIAGIMPEQCLQLNIPDLEAAHHVRGIANAIRRLNPGRLFTHAYEGGHPDHDACAVAARRALARLPGTKLFEMPYYHLATGSMRASEFISRDGTGVHAGLLSRAAVARRQAMFACHQSQRHVFGRFDPLREPYRQAPEYDFRQPPHAGTLYYETRPMGWTFDRWREVATRR
jgi:LmbE family N-acetylglucosaminyl deacetylase